MAKNITFVISGLNLKKINQGSLASVSSDSRIPTYRYWQKTFNSLAEANSSGDIRLATYAMLILDTPLI